MNHKIIQIDLVMVILKFCDYQLIEKIQMTRRGNCFDQNALTQVCAHNYSELVSYQYYTINNYQNLPKVIMMDP